MCRSMLLGRLRLEQDAEERLFKPYHMGLYFGGCLGIMRGKLDRRIRHQAPAPPFGRGKKIDQTREELSDGGESSHRLLQFTHKVSHNGVTVAFEGCHKQLVLASEGTVQTEAVNAHTLDEVIHRRGFIAALPEDLHGLLECGIRIKGFGSWHRRWLV